MAKHDDVTVSVVIGAVLAALAIAVSLAACSSDDEPNVPTDAGAIGDSERSDDAGEPPDAADARTIVVDSGRDAMPLPECPAPAMPRSYAPGPMSAHPLDDVLRLNHLQAEATHNSYHVPSTEDAGEWEYTHVALDVQLEQQGVRGIELDVHWNERCARFEVFHIGLFDEGTTCRVFTDCLALVRAFSETHPGHHPIFVQIEPKDAAAVFDEARFEAFDREILSVFAREWIITPDEVRGGSATLAEGIAEHGWPTLGATRGRLLFYLDDADAPREVYTHGGRDLDGRLMFVDSDLDAPYAGVIVLNDPVGDALAIADALAGGFVVRTRADSSPVSVRAGDVHLEAALASGAQIVTTDFPAPVGGLDYFVEIPGGMPSRCSPVTAPSECTSLAIEDPMRLSR